MTFEGNKIRLIVDSNKKIILTDEFETALENFINPKELKLDAVLKISAGDNGIELSCGNGIETSWGEK